MKSNRSRRPVLTSATDAVGMIPTGATVALTGAGGGVMEPEALLAALEARFLDSGAPRGLTVVYALGMGDRIGGGRLPERGAATVTPPREALQIAITAALTCKFA